MKRLWKGLLAALLVLVVGVFAGCFDFGETIPLEEGRSKMEESRYEVAEMTETELREYMADIEVGAVTALCCTREDTKDMLIAVWFENELLAKAFETAVNAKADEIHQKAAEEGYTVQYKSEGAVFYLGTPQACQDFLREVSAENSAS